ncbi:MAG: hypothetical protein IIA59_05045 [Candidatus Marinimicrobia bacterium]|nr:hypothetical protein [Candidatus Neomarinimicrobiota bacterium]
MSCPSDIPTITDDESGQNNLSATSRAGSGGYAKRADTSVIMGPWPKLLTFMRRIMGLSGPLTFEGNGSKMRAT